MVQLELLNEKNEKCLLGILREDIPEHYVEEVSSTIDLAKYGEKLNLKGHCFAIKYDESYVGIILIGEAIACEEDPDTVKGKEYFRIIGFVIDRRYRGIGIGSVALKLVIEAIYKEYGRVILLLECHKDNSEAIRFYEKNGFCNTNIINANDENYFLIMK